MKTVWQLQEAKNRLSEVVETARKRGPQTITRHGKPAVVVISVEEYSQLAPEKRTLLDWFRDCPGPELAELAADRLKEPIRDIDLD